MKLTAIFLCNQDIYSVAMAGGKSNGNPRRVTIELTEEQAEKLKPKYKGEEISMLFIEFDNTSNE